MNQPPIRDYALLSDCHSTALVSRAGSVDWCCFHRADSHPVFGRLLDWDRGGHCEIAPAGPAEVRRRYLPGTNVLETRFLTDRGELTVTDCLAVRPESTDPDPLHQLLRLIRCETGSVTVEVDLRPRFDFGLTVPRLDLGSPTEGVVLGGADALIVQSSFDLEQVELCGVVARLTLSAGDEGFLAITHVEPHLIEIAPLDLGTARERVTETARWWDEWSDGCSYQGPWREQVLRSALVLKGLTNAPTGALVAAATTSLPEHIGGSRNWDYRYTWLRDSAMNLYALFRLGYTDEAHAFMGWLARTTAGHAGDLQPVYGVGGERLLPEVELTALAGYRDSRPVRIGNAAAGQLQLDVYGELADTAWLYHRHGGTIDDALWELLTGIVEVIAERWADPDAGMWEVRDGGHQFVSSKVMTWVAVDRAIRLADQLDLPADLPAWRELAQQIRDSVEAHGVDPVDGAFRRAYGEDGTDAANLLIPLVRFLPPDDPRVRATVRRVQTELTVDGLVHRYCRPDGLPGEEGAFLLCSFWLADNLALIGEVDEATELFQHLLGYANDVGLLPEQIDSVTGAGLGNFPQAFSHLGLINAAYNLDRASRP